MKEFDDLDDLERELGPSLRVALRRAAESITGEPRTDTRPESRNAVQTPAVQTDDTIAHAGSASDARGPEDDGAEVTVVDLAPETHQRNARRRWLVAAAAAAAVILIAGTVLVLAAAEDGTRANAPAGQDTTATADSTSPTTVPRPSTTVEAPPATAPGDASTEARLLPAGAPSTPHVGELVASASPGLISVSGSAPHPLAYHLYADGRLVHWEDAAGGYVEQHLTPEGVERVRSAFLTSGLFDLTQPPSDVPPCTDWLQVCVRGDDGELLTSPPGPTAELEELLSYLDTLDASLPETEWEDEEFRPYVASRIATCVQTYVDVPDQVDPVAHDPSVVLPLLPERAASLLSSSEAIADPNRPNQASCYEVTLEDARSLAEELLSPAVGGSHQYWGIVIQDDRFDVIQPETTEGIALFVSFDALLPDGVVLPSTSGG